MTDENRPSRGQVLMAATKALACDVAAVAGGGLITYGVWLIHPPSGFIAAGTFVLAAAVLVVRAS